MTHLKKVLMCGIVGAIFGGLLGYGESTTVIAIFSIIGFIIISMIYGFIFLIYYMTSTFQKCSGETILHPNDHRYDTDFYDENLIKNPSYRIDEHGNSSLDARWLSREN